MANPDIKSPSSIRYANAQVSLTSTSATQLISNAANSGKVLLIDTITVANVDGVNACDVSVVRFQSATNTGTAYPIGSTIAVPADATLIVVGRENPISLTEGQSVYVTASAANDLVVDVNWKEVT